jgi:hypothetical protein
MVGDVLTASLSPLDVKTIETPTMEFDVSFNHIKVQGRGVQVMRNGKIIAESYTSTISRESMSLAFEKPNTADEQAASHHSPNNGKGAGIPTPAKQHADERQQRLKAFLDKGLITKKHYDREAAKSGVLR